MKLFTKIFLQVICMVLLLSSGIFFYTTYRWKNQSIENINSYENSRFQTNISKFENMLHIAKLNGRICGAKRSHSVFEQPNCYQSV